MLTQLQALLRLKINTSSCDKPCSKYAKLIFGGVRACLLLAVVGLGSAAAKPAAAATAYPIWDSSFNYLPAISNASGVMPLQVKATWSTQFSLLLNAKQLSSYPWYNRIYVVWGDGTAQEISSSSVLNPPGAPTGLTRKTWKTQSLTHKYSKAGTFSIKLMYTNSSGKGYSEVIQLVTVKASTAKARTAVLAGAAALPNSPNSSSTPLASISEEALIAADESGDQDGDGTLDQNDPCPADAGPTSAQGCPIVRSFDITYMTFVPANRIAVTDPKASCTSSGKTYQVVYNGDDRDFGLGAYEQKKFRLAQRATVTQKVDNLGRSTFTLAAEETKQSASLSFRAGEGSGSALKNGKVDLLDPADQDKKLGDCWLLTARRTNEEVTWTEPAIIAKTADSVTIAFRGVVPTGLLPTLPEAEWNFRVVINTATDRPRVQVSGLHAVFPAYEIYINDQALMQYSPLRSDKLPVKSIDGGDRAWQHTPTRLATGLVRLASAD